MLAVAKTRRRLAKNAQAVLIGALRALEDLSKRSELRSPITADLDALARAARTTDREVRRAAKRPRLALSGRLPGQ